MHEFPHERRIRPVETREGRARGTEGLS
jgi:hypothetical protein